MAGKENAIGPTTVSCPACVCCCRQCCCWLGASRLQAMRFLPSQADIVLNFLTGIYVDRNEEDVTYNWPRVA